MSDAKIEVGEPARPIEFAACNVPSPLPKRMLRVLVALSAAAMSVWPSPLKSPTTTAVGSVLVTKSRAACKLPSLLVRRMLTP